MRSARLGLGLGLGLGLANPNQNHNHDRANPNPKPNPKPNPSPSPNPNHKTNITQVCSGEEHLDEMLNCCLLTRNDVRPGTYGQRELPDDNRTVTKNTGLPPLVVIGFQKARSP